MLAVSGISTSKMMRCGPIVERLPIVTLRPGAMTVPKLMSTSSPISIRPQGPGEQFGRNPGGVDIEVIADRDRSAVRDAHSTGDAGARAHAVAILERRTRPQQLHGEPQSLLDTARETELLIARPGPLDSRQQAGCPRLLCTFFPGHLYPPLATSAARR